MALGPAFSREVHQRLGRARPADLEAAVLSCLLELRLREVLSLATRFARHAGRGGRLLLGDVADAATTVCSDAMSGAGVVSTGSGGPWLPVLLRCPQPLSRSEQITTAVASAAVLPTPPKERRLRVEWLAVDGFPVDRVGFSATAMEPMPAIAAPQSDAPPSFALLSRLTSLWDNHAEPAPRLRSIILGLCGEGPEREALRSLLADFVSLRVDSLVEARRRGISTRVGSRIGLLLDLLEELALGAEGLELHLQQCVSSALRLCLCPSRGRGSGDGDDELTVGDRRRAAALLAAISTRFATDLPELAGHLSDAFGEALQRRPDVGAATGAACGLAALGKACIERILVPALLSGKLNHLAPECTTTHNSKSSQQCSLTATEFGSLSQDLWTLMPATTSPTTNVGGRQVAVGVLGMEGLATLLGTDASLQHAGLAARMRSWDHSEPTCAERSSDDALAPLASATATALAKDARRNRACQRTGRQRSRSRSRSRSERHKSWTQSVRWGSGGQWTAEGERDPLDLLL